VRIFEKPICIGPISFLQISLKPTLREHSFAVLTSRRPILTNASLKNANLSRDNVGGFTQLQGANLTGANVSGTNFEGAEYDDETVFPESFDPKKHKMVFKS